MNYKYETDALTETTEHCRQRSIPRNRNSVISKKQHVLSIFIIATLRFRTLIILLQSIKIN